MHSEVNAGLRGQGETHACGRDKRNEDVCCDSKKSKLLAALPVRAQPLGLPHPLHVFRTALSWQQTSFRINIYRSREEPSLSSLVIYATIDLDVIKFPSPHKSRQICILCLTHSFLTVFGEPVLTVTIWSRARTGWHPGSKPPPRCCAACGASPRMTL